MAEKSQKLGRFSSFFLFKERNWLFGNWNARTEDDILRSFPTWNWNWIIGIFNIEQHYQVVEFLYGRDTIKIPRKFPNFEIETGLSRLLNFSGRKIFRRKSTILSDEVDRP